MQKISHKGSMRRSLSAIIISAIAIVSITIIAKTTHTENLTHQVEDLSDNIENVSNKSEESGSDSKELSDVKDILDTITSDVIYVQHDDNGKDIYILSSQGDTTTVYQILNVNLTAAKQWTETGLYVNNTENDCCATAPNEYIHVKEGEEYFIRLFGMQDDYIGENGQVLSHVTPVLFTDDNDKAVGSALAGTYTDGENGIEISVPSGATRMHITYANYHAFSIQKKVVLNKEQFDQIKNQQDALLSSVDDSYENYKNDPILYDEFDKAYITFVNEGINDDIDKIADLFISKNAPLCFSTSSGNMLNSASNMTETRQDVALRIQKSGGEILAHNDQVVTEDKLSDTEFMYEYFKASRQKLINMGFDVNGILLTGGDGQIMGSPDTARWVYSTYDYSDLYGEPYNGLEGLSSVYYRWGDTGLYEFNNDVQEIKNYIDQLIENKNWAVLSFQGLSDVNNETLNEVLDYINSKRPDSIEIATYKKMYDRLAKKESVIKNTVKTYYVSANGTGRDGTDIEDPISLDVLKTKRIKTGDTILFKSGDTFFGNVELQILDANDKKIRISSYGEGSRPTISAYKYVENNWEKSGENVYRIDILDESKYTGYTSRDPDAFNIGFIEDDDGNKYYQKKSSVDQLAEKYDFYSDGERYLYFRSEQDPYETLGGLKLAVNTKLFVMASNMEIDNLRFACTGGHALQIGSSPAKNVRISNCLIEDIGGSYLDPDYDERYGNGIEFYGCDAENIEITDNIIRNVYDVAFTIQGDVGSGRDILVHDNVFVKNAQDSEIWEGSAAAGINNYQFYNNISINQGRGWGYDARPDQDASAHILLYEYMPETADFGFHHNSIYNPLRVYSIKPSMEDFFTDNFIKSDYNTYYMGEDARIFNYIFPFWEKDDFISWAHKEEHSSFISLSEIDREIVNMANTSDDIKSIKKAFEDISKK